MFHVDYDHLYIDMAEGPYKFLWSDQYRYSSLGLPADAIEIKLQCGVILDSHFTVEDFGEVFNVEVFRDKVVSNEKYKALACLRKVGRQKENCQLRISRTHVSMLSSAGFLLWSRRYDLPRKSDKGRKNVSG